MRRVYCLVMLSAILLISGFYPIPTEAASEIPRFGIGDYWEYEYVGELENESEIDAVMRMEIIDRNEENIGGSSQEVFLLELSGSGNMTIDIEELDLIDGVEISGEFLQSGMIKRLASNFSLISSETIFEMEIDLGLLSVDMTIGIGLECEPPFNDYLGDDAIYAGMELESGTEMEYKLWIGLMGLNNTMESESSEVIMSFEILQEDIAVTTPAGTFDCYEIRVCSTDSEEYFTWYYCDTVGNYVKMDGGSMTGIAMGDVELISYSYGSDDDLLSLFTGENSWITWLFIIAIIVVIGIILSLRNRGRKRTTVLPPQENLPDNLNDRGDQVIH